MNADLRAGMTVLDIGGGYSKFALSIVRTFGKSVRVVVADPCFYGGAAPVGVESTSGALPNLPFHERTFDRVFCLSTLEHLPGEDVAGVACELHRILRPGGRAIVTVDHFLNLNEWLTRRDNTPPRWLPNRENLPPDLLGVCPSLVPLDQEATDPQAIGGCFTDHDQEGLTSTSWGMVLQRKVVLEDNEEFVFSPNAICAETKGGVREYRIDLGASRVANWLKRMTDDLKLDAEMALQPWRLSEILPVLPLGRVDGIEAVNALLASGAVLESSEYMTAGAANEDIRAKYKVV